MNESTGGTTNRIWTIGLEEVYKAKDRIAINILVH